MDVFNSECKTSEQFSFHSTCTNKYNFVELVSNNESYNTLEEENLRITLTDIRNPETNGQSGNIILYNKNQNE